MSTIQEFFASIAPAYDRTNAILSFGAFKRWNRALIKRTAKNLDGPLLDLCAGTGEIAFGVLRRCHTPQQAILLDFCPEMLEIARHKMIHLERHDINYLQADAQKIPLPDASVAAVTTSYGIRNIADPLECGREVLRVLRPGGTWRILELTRPSIRWMRSLHRAYLRHLLPRIGRLMTTNEAAYQHLSRSVQDFLDPDELANQLEALGFKQPRLTSLLFGTATLIELERGA